MIDKELLSILACPACRGDVAEENGKIVCANWRRQYPLEYN